jgi:hypothetical protein
MSDKRSRIVLKVALLLLGLRSGVVVKTYAVLETEVTVAVEGTWNGTMIVTAVGNGRLVKSHTMLLRSVAF